MSMPATDAKAHVVRVVLDEEAFLDHQFAHGLWRRYHWPARWIVPEGPLALPILFAARCLFDVNAQDGPIRIHVSADERFELYLDGELIARGPERGDLNNWSYQTYDITSLPAGPHLLSARVWAMGDAAPVAQLSAGPGFLLGAEGTWGERLSTGHAHWETTRMDAVEIRHYPAAGHDGFTGKRIRVDAARFRFGVEADREPGGHWSAARVSHAATTGTPTDRTSQRTLRAARLPDMLRQPILSMRCRFAEYLDAAADLPGRPCHADRADSRLVASVQSWLEGKGPLRVEPGSRLRAVVDLDQYYCAYPTLITRGGRGAEIDLEWAESLYVDPERNQKGHRDEVEGKRFLGFADTFVPDGMPGRRFSTFWWRAGRYLQLHIRTGSEALELEAIDLEETRYPLVTTRMPLVDDPALAKALDLSLRSIEVCLHETFMDSPYYEQLAYVGDARLEALTLLSISDDSRPVRKVIELFDASRLPSGWTQSRYPCRVMQVIPTFSMLWVGMVHDFLRLGDDRAFVRARLPGVRAVIDECIAQVDPESGLLRNPPGWNFIDWAAGFPDGVPPSGVNDACGPVNWQFALALRWWADLEEAVGEPEMHARATRWHKRIARAADDAFWCESRQAWADDLARGHFSEHAQALAILANARADRAAAAMRTLITPDPTFARATIYFTHYVLEVLRGAGEWKAFNARLDLWRSLTGLGLRCLPEQPEPTRSDCHGWGSHLIYHLLQIADSAGAAGASAELGFQLRG